MKRQLTLLALGVGLVIGMPLSSLAAQKLAPAASSASPATPAERAAMARAYVLKWGAYVQRTYNVPVRVWAERMVPTFAGADVSNFRLALQRNTYEGASAELSGAGSKLSDAQVVDTMARASLVPPVSRAQVTAALLGAATNDLVYTPVTPCRILDTRIAGGPLAGGFTRDFNAVVGGGGNFSSQGGSATDCGGVAAGQAAAVINVTAVAPSTAGYATVYPFGATQPLASSVNYSAGAIVNNTVVVKLPNPLTTKDFTIFSYATSGFVADIVGYYAPPQATALSCTVVAGAPTSVLSGEYKPLPTLFCPATYTPVDLAISAFEDVLVADTYTAGSSGVIYVRSLSLNTQNVTGKMTCCRVPGR